MATQNLIPGWAAVLRPKPVDSIHSSTSGAFFYEEAIPHSGFYWRATNRGLTVQIGRTGDKFASVSSPFGGHPNRADHYAEMLAQMNGLA
jgi:hypothetical protein